jgi:nucleoside-diphosphate-sugar epimerase
LKALVTGAGGFLGRYIVEALVARGDGVRGFVRRPTPYLDDLGAEMAIGDIRDEGQVSAACRGVDVVFHVASIAGIWGRWESYYSTNVLGTRNAIAACREHGVPRLVYTSSPSVTFDPNDSNGGDQAGVDESTPYPKKWYCPYSHTKALAEQEILAANGASGLTTCSLRPHLIWGPRDSHLIPRIIARARSGRLVRVGTGANLIDITHVENAAMAHLSAADALSPHSPLAGQAYFLSQGEPVNCWQWVDEVLASIDLPPVEVSVSFRAAWRLGFCIESAYRLLRIEREPAMTRFLAAQMAKSHYFDISKAQRDFGYSPKISTVEGMKGLGAWLRAENGAEEGNTAKTE